MLRALHNLRDGLLSLAYPQDCRVCGRAVDSFDDGVVCAPCWNDPAVTLLFINQETCQKCGALLPAVRRFDQKPAAQGIEAVVSVDPAMDPAMDKAGGPGRQCGRCGELPFRLARACGAYRGSLEASLLFLKSEPHICRRLRRLITQTIASAQTELAADVVIPVPLHAARKAERGFNQAERIAALIASEFHWPLSAHLLSRVKDTARHRAGMDAADRRRSVERAFVVDLEGRVAGQKVLLVDDLFTTGSTISAAATALLAAGASAVNVFTVARVTRESEAAAIAR